MSFFLFRRRQREAEKRLAEAGKSPAVLAQIDMRKRASDACREYADALRVDDAPPSEIRIANICAALVAQLPPKV